MLKGWQRTEHEAHNVVQALGELLESLVFMFPDVSIKWGVIKRYSNWVTE